MTLGKIITLAKRCRSLGPWHSLQLLAHLSRVKLDMAALQCLRLAFGFDRWHARSPDSTRPYRRQIASLVNDLGPTRVVEVGCGLGGIISRITAKSLIGYDVDPSLIRAARFLHGRSAWFKEGGFEQVDEAEIDVLIAFNWMHEFPPEQIESWIAPLVPRVRYLIVDAINPGSDGGYPYFHDFAFLETKASKTSVGAKGEPHRRLILWKVNR